MGIRQVSKDVKKSLGRIENAYYVGGRGDGIPKIMQLFGCQCCSWSGSILCPHGLLIGKKHSNGICSQRVLYLKEQLQIVGTVPRLIQNEEAVKLKMVTDRMLWQYSETGELHDDFKALNKNLISLIDKMRKQDEGIKFQGELTVAHEDFRKLVEVEAKRIEERNNKTRPGEFTEEVSDN